MKTPFALSVKIELGFHIEGRFFNFLRERPEGLLSFPSINSLTPCYRNDNEDEQEMRAISITFVLSQCVEGVKRCCKKKKERRGHGAPDGSPLRPLSPRSLHFHLKGGKINMRRKGGKEGSSSSARSLSVDFYLPSVVLYSSSSSSSPSSSSSSSAFWSHSTNFSVRSRRARERSRSIFLEGFLCHLRMISSSRTSAS